MARMTMEQVMNERKRLAEIEVRIGKLQKIESANRALSGEHFLVTIEDATNTLMNAPNHISLVLNDHEQAVLAKSIQVVLEFAKNRIEKEMES
jgi:hypothetical protein